MGLSRGFSNFGSGPKIWGTPWRGKGGLKKSKKFFLQIRFFFMGSDCTMSFIPKMIINYVKQLFYLPFSVFQNQVETGYPDLKIFLKLVKRGFNIK